MYRTAVRDVVRILLLSFLPARFEPDCYKPELGNKQKGNDNHNNVRSANPLFIQPGSCVSYSKRADQRLRSEHAIRRVLGAIRYNGRDVGILDSRKGKGGGGALMRWANQPL